MKFCDCCEELGEVNPAHYNQEWIRGSGTGVITDLNVCEEHIILDVDRSLLAQGYTLTLRRIEP